MTSSIRTIRRARLASAAVSLALLTGGLAACSSGDDSTKTFCDTYKSVAEDTSLDDLDSSDLGGTVDKISDVNDKVKDVDAPDEISSDWDTMKKFLADFSKAFDGVDTSDQAAVQTAAAGLTDLASEASSMQTSATKVSDWAKDNCK
ncbi:hypothetical protein [Luteimicrobium subarcticum]|uniref:Uncharacterized protein n=1 Tax=Luteimicrobium subarcticum TaxID=620910 RepID=A0A2M8WTN5_9MICO|nr:hypothetical protein [Luteimicrobium subarcticum]PJI94311.1 hypothetical protein CLV34_0147 [Luteimicrobium subarcticum]